MKPLHLLLLYYLLLGCKKEPDQKVAISGKDDLVGHVIVLIGVVLIGVMTYSQIVMARNENDWGEDVDDKKSESQ